MGARDGAAGPEAKGVVRRARTSGQYMGLATGKRMNPTPQRRLTRPRWKR
jgi:hypothetical protein